MNLKTRRHCEMRKTSKAFRPAFSSPLRLPLNRITTPVEQDPKVSSVPRQFTTEDGEKPLRMRMLFRTYLMRTLRSARARTRRIVRPISVA